MRRLPEMSDWRFDQIEKGIWTFGAGAITALIVLFTTNNLWLFAGLVGATPIPSIMIACRPSPIKPQTPPAARPRPMPQMYLRPETIGEVRQMQADEDRLRRQLYPPSEHKGLRAPRRLVPGAGMAEYPQDST